MDKVCCIGVFLLVIGGVLFGVNSVGNKANNLSNEIDILLDEHEESIEQFNKEIDLALENGYSVMYYGNEVKVSSRKDIDILGAYVYHINKEDRILVLKDTQTADDYYKPSYWYPFYSPIFR